VQGLCRKLKPLEAREYQSCRLPAGSSVPGGSNTKATAGSGGATGFRR
jgi:hypothetical protein